VEKLLTAPPPTPDVAASAKLSVLTLLTLFAFLVATLVPQAVAATPFPLDENPPPFVEGQAMQSKFLSLAILFGLTAPIVADDPAQPTPEPQATAELKETPDTLPPGIRRFRGILVGRLVKKDVERGTFTITVDAVPRVGNNNRAGSPKSLIGQQVDADRVPSQMLDVLVVCRLGDTIEFGALSDGGETLRLGLWSPPDASILSPFGNGFPIAGRLACERHWQPSPGCIRTAGRGRSAIW